MYIIVIVILAGILGIGTWLFVGENAPARTWIQNVFNNNMDAKLNNGEDLQIHRGSCHSSGRGS